MHGIEALITLFFIGAIVVLIVTHAPGAMGVGSTLFGGVNSMGSTLTGTGVTNAVYPGPGGNIYGPGLTNAAGG